VNLLKNVSSKNHRKMKKVKKLVLKKTAIVNLDEYTMNQLKGGYNAPVDNTKSTNHTLCGQSSCVTQCCPQSVLYC
jgi:natural product precursor